MKKLNEFVKEYVAPTFPNISELETIPTDAPIEEREEEFNGKKQNNHYIVVDGVEYRMPTSVLVDLKTNLEENPNAKAFKVRKDGEGLKTRYTVIMK